MARKSGSLNQNVGWKGQGYSAYFNSRIRYWGSTDGTTRFPMGDPSSDSASYLAFIPLKPTDVFNSGLVMVSAIKRNVDPSVIGREGIHDVLGMIPQLTTERGDPLWYLLYWARPAFHFNRSRKVKNGGMVISRPLALIRQRKGDCLFYFDSSSQVRLPKQKY